MELNEYQKLAMRTLNKNVKEPLLEGLMGLNGEAGEAIEIAKKSMFQGHELDYEKLTEELGDNLWYIAECAHAIGKSLDEIAKKNLEKLYGRYPNGFSEEKSVNRMDIDEHDPVYRL